MGLFKKKKTKKIKPVTSRTDDSRNFVIPQIEEEKKEEIKRIYEPTTFVSPIFGNNVTDRVYVPLVQGEQAQDLDRYIDPFRVNKKITPEIEKERYGETFAEFSIISAKSIDDIPTEVTPRMKQKRVFYGKVDNFNDKYSITKSGHSTIYKNSNYSSSIRVGDQKDLQDDTSFKSTVLTRDRKIIFKSSYSNDDKEQALDSLSSIEPTNIPDPVNDYNEPYSVDYTEEYNDIEEFDNDIEYSVNVEDISYDDTRELEALDDEYSAENVVVEEPPKIKSVNRGENTERTPSFLNQKINRNAPKNLNENRIGDKYKDKVVEKEVVDYSSYQLPPLSLLDNNLDNVVFDDSWILSQIEILNNTLIEFNVGGHVKTYTKGPTVTRYEFQLDSGVNVKRVTSLEQNLKMALAATDIRMEAPIPGKSTIGIEVPNVEPEIVKIGNIINEDFKLIKKNLPIALGLDIDGKSVISSIAEMPHGLVAGATGSGKSVCINTILISLLYRYKPDELKLLLIDPKTVELQPYLGLPHLITPVINDAKVATASLKWAVDEMERRFSLFSQTHARNIVLYNDKVNQYENHSKIPYIVVIIDELSDLMSVADGDVENNIKRIAQKARACGIHLIIATQRPSTDVISGTIKSNIPSRIAFRVASIVDSRTILDYKGAETLLGKGDMLFFESGRPKRRIQGAFVSDEEIYSVIDFIKAQFGEDYLFELDALNSNTIPDIGKSNDDLVFPVAKYVIESERCSMNAISKRFGIGFNRAQKIVDTLELLGIVSENLGSRAREVLVTTVEELEVVMGA